ncbi:RNA polymerase sigma factor [Myroides guanonis]|uniref:RNA polymerase sigma-70 factor, ECF subfamily n=1 Tax=Myroides guanonis TaxID=1150112 RepID=A0A1I3NKU8_9FLAO|nr:sigma-70 family RNA polymerase sigma factor [Myroides guanonis]SFJ09802.1 RNA polymerase sigma-70 factor, ECF subfamily [Myroides guanonis]
MKKVVDEHINAAKQGDQVAFTFLLNHYWSEVYHFILKSAQNEADTEDITIETFSKAFSRITTYNPEYAFNTWLLTIAKNVHIDLIRNRRNNPVFPINEEDSSLYQNIIDESPSIEDEIIQRQKLRIFEAYVELLKPHYQEVIKMRYFQDMSYNEISEQLQEPLNTVKVKIMRAKKLLAEIIVKQIDKRFEI